MPIAESITRLQEQANAGDAEAQVKLATRYLRGDGVPVSPETAAKWVRKAAGQNHGVAQFMLGITYAIGYGLPKDDRAAVEWFQKAARNGIDLKKERATFSANYEQLRTEESNEILAHIAKYEKLRRGLDPRSETYQDVDGSFRFYEGSVSDRQSRDSEAMMKRLKATRAERARRTHESKRIVELIDDAIVLKPDSQTTPAQ